MRDVLEFKAYIGFHSHRRRFSTRKMRTAFIKTGCQLRKEMKLIFVIGMFFISSSL